MNDRPASGTPAPRRPFAAGLAVAFVACALDQASKSYILHQVMAPPRVIEVTPFFNLVLGWNRGVSFGMFSNDSPYGPFVLTAVAAVIVAALAAWLWRATTRITVAAIGLIIGGAVGNVIDRLQFGAVVDFLDFHWGGYHWPAFNLADTAIVVGAGLLILESLFARDHSS